MWELTNGEYVCRNQGDYVGTLACKNTQDGSIVHYYECRCSHPTNRDVNQTSDDQGEPNDEANVD